MTEHTQLSITPPPPLTEEERRQVLAAIQRINRRWADMFAARGGRRFPEASDEVAAMCAEREAGQP